MQRWSRWLGAGMLFAAAAYAMAVSAGYAQPPFGKGKFGRPFPELRKDKGDLTDREREGQPPREGERKERKEGERKEAERKEVKPEKAKEDERLARPRPPAGEPPRPSAEQRVRMLERELFELQNRMQQVIQELAQAHWEWAQERMGRGPGGPPFGPFGPAAPPRGPIFGGPFGRPMDRPPQADGLPPIERMAERLNNEQLKELINRLRQTLEQRIGGGTKEPKQPKEPPRGDKKPQKDPPPGTDKPVKLPPVEQMSPQQIRDLIQQLQKALDERSDDKKKRVQEDD